MRFFGVLLFMLTTSALAQTALVLGAAQWDGTPSPVFARRLDQAFELYQDQTVQQVLVTGGRQPGDRFSEGEAGCQYLQDKGIPPADLLCETTSHNTWENLQNSLDLLPPGEVYLVTDAPHLPRALLMAHRLGLEASGVAVEGEFSTRYYLREMVYYLLAQFGFH